MFLQVELVGVPKYKTAFFTAMIHLQNECMRMRISNCFFQVWKVSIPLPTYEEWHFVELTWSPDSGIKVWNGSICLVHFNALLIKVITITSHDIDYSGLH